MRPLAFIILCAFFGSWSAAMDVPALVGNLSADDPLVREQAGRDLLTAGPSARPALVAALRSPDPELRLRAGQLLLQMPWTSPDDPPAVRDVMAQYGKPQLAERNQKIEILASLPNQAGVPALLRLLVEEPADSIRWRICGCFRHIQSSKTWDALRQMDSAGQGAPQLAAVGWAWAHYDPRRAVQFMHQSLIEDADRPDISLGELELILLYLIEQEQYAGNFDEAARLIRLAMNRIDYAPHNTWAMQLMALHVEHGSLEGYQQDRITCQSILKPTLWLYVEGKLDQRDGKIDQANKKFQQAIETKQSLANHLQTGELLLQRGWDDLAERELNRVLQPPFKPKGVHLANAHFLLARVADRRGDDFQTAEHLRLGLEATGQTNGAVLTRKGRKIDNSSTAATNPIWAQVYRHYYRAAADRGDSAQARQNLDKLLALHDGSAEIAMDLTPRLLADGHNNEAKQLFESAYQPAKTLRDLDPENPELLNNLAWLCARAGQNLAEALKDSRQATAIAPHHPAYLDTQAEAEYRNGHRETAISLEKRALELRPHDPFMQKQLKRFEAGNP
ncbi:MAG: hypothetical protein IT446_04715 [Phycisphaerales bacterium]|nr:hypothetical protein [Phycisphaerales bacterium]